MSLTQAVEASVAIVGGGPGGVATAIALANAGMRDVLLFDNGCPSNDNGCPSNDNGCRSTTSRPVIGETIPPAATPLLRRLGIINGAEFPGHLRNRGSQSVWGSGAVGFNDFMLDPAGVGYHLDRTRFNAQLKETAAVAGVRLISSAHLRTVRMTGGEAQLTFNLPAGERLKCQTGFAVDATGAPAAVARRIGVARNVMDNLISLCALINTVPYSPIDDYTLIEATESGWWYGARLPDNRLILSFTSDPETLRQFKLYDVERWRLAFKQTRFMQARIPPGLLGRVSALIPKGAPTAILSAVAGDHWLAVGDAASAYDPITSAGITKALGNGLAAGEAIAAQLLRGDKTALQRYQKSIFHDFTAHVKLRNSFYEAETRWSNTSPFWKRRLFGAPGTVGMAPCATL